MSITRREFLGSGVAGGVLGVSQSLFPRWMPRLAFGQAGSRERDVLVVVFNRGGMDGLNAVIPFGEGAGYYDRRPTIAIAEPDGTDNSAINLNDFFGLHPRLRPLKDIYDANRLTIIHGVGSPDPSRSHFEAMEFMERGIPGDKMTPTGWVARHLASANWTNNSPFRAVGMGTMLPASLRGEISALALRSIADFHLGGRQDQLAQVQQTLSGLYRVETPTDILSAQAAQVFNTINQLQDIAEQNYIPEYGAQYPESEFGYGLRQIAQLIKADIGLEVACVDSGGWDTHDGQGSVDGEMAYLLDDFAQGLAAFYADIQDHIHRVTVVTMSEFGRTASENASAGTDHGRASVMFVMGGGATGGVYADWRGLTDDVMDDGDLAVTTDYRDILAELLIKRVKNTAIDQIFPNHRVNLHDLFVE